jgi:hypothetical protein
MVDPAIFDWPCDDRKLLVGLANTIKARFMRFKQYESFHLVQEMRKIELVLDDKALPVSLRPQIAGLHMYRAEIQDSRVTVVEWFREWSLEWIDDVFQGEPELAEKVRKANSPDFGIVRNVFILCFIVFSLIFFLQQRN